MSTSNTPRSRDQRRAFCPDCRQPVMFNPQATRRRLDVLLVCRCGLQFNPFERTARGKTEQQKRSQQQEATIAARRGGHRQPASGAGPHAKGDVRQKFHHLIEAKVTTGKSFTLKAEDLLRLSSYAAQGEAPIMEIRFTSTVPPVEVCVVPRWYLESLEQLRRPTVPTAPKKGPDGDPHV